MQEIEKAMLERTMISLWATQVLTICDRARVRVSGRRIAAVLQQLLGPQSPDAAGFDAAAELVEREIARLQSIAGGLR